MKIFVNLLLIFIYLNIQSIYGQNAPVSTIGNPVTYDAMITVPITATDFNNIGSCNLQILYNSAEIICTSVTKGTSLPGGLAANLTVPGIITIGWYAYPEVTLPDNSIIFNLNFTRIEYGFSAITWDNEYPIRQWNDDSSPTPLNDLPLENYYINGSATFLTMDAPATIAPDLTAIQGSTVNIPVTISDFNNIGTLDLKLDYNNTVLTYQSFTNNSGFPGLAVDGSFPGTVTIAGTATTGIFLSDNVVLFTLNFIYQGGTTDLTWNDDGASCQYEGYPDYILIDTPSEEYYFNGSVNEAIRLGMTLFLEGPFNNGKMTTSINDMALIPLSQPYSVAPWNYEDLESVTSIPEDVTDWVLVELRETSGDASTATAEKSISKRAGFLMQDGSIKDLDGISNIIFPVLPVGNLFIVIYHRNHVAVISANPVLLFNGNGYYNFSSGEFQALGGNLGHKELSAGIWGLAAGDSNGDGSINDLDKLNSWNTNVGTMGYYSADFSCDTQVDNKDKNDFWHLNFGFTSQVP